MLFDEDEAARVTRACAWVARWLAGSSEPWTEPAIEVRTRQIVLDHGGGPATVDAAAGHCFRLRVAPDRVTIADEREPTTADGVAMVASLRIIAPEVAVARRRPGPGPRD